MPRLLGGWLPVTSPEGSGAGAPFPNMETAIAIIIIAVLLGIDCAQTMDLFGRGYGERNPLLRGAWHRWGLAGIVGYFTIGAGIASALWSIHLSPSASAFRLGATGILIVAEAVTVRGNWRLLG